MTELGNASFGGASIAQLTLPQAQFITDKVGQFDQISVAAAKGVTPTELRARIEKVVPTNVRVETAQQNADRQSSEIHDDLGFLSIALFVFAGVALVVGAFVIFNTFSITVAQRVREFGMLRTIGASRRQILTSVVAESLLIGIVGAVLGLFAGLAIAQGIHGLFQAIGADLPTTALVVETQDGGGLAADRDRGDRAVVAEPGAALHPGPADGGTAARWSCRRRAGARSSTRSWRVRWLWSGWRWC